MASFILNIPGLDIYRNNGCSRCGADHNLVDTDVTIDYEGALAFCRGCIADFALAAGLVVKESVVAALRSDLAAADARAKDAESKLRAVRRSMK